jgi:FkbM family methyltransferase
MLGQSIFRRARRLFHLIDAFGIFAAFHYINSKSAFRADRPGKPVYLRTKLASYPVLYRPSTSDLEVFEQIFVEREYACLDDLESARLIVDCGANVGYSSAYWLSRLPMASVIAIEPDPENFSILQRNLQPYGARASAIQAGVWSSNVGLVIANETYRDGREWSRQVRPVRLGEEPAFRAIDIGSVLSDDIHRRIDLLKIDIERAETEVFSANYEHWLGRVDNLVIELHDDECRKIFFDAIRNQGFDVSESGELTIYRRRSSRAG